MAQAHVFAKRWQRDDGTANCHSCNNFIGVGEKCVIFVSKKSLKARALCPSCALLITEASGTFDRESLAAFFHDVWARWMKYMFNESRGALLATPAWVINTESYKRWRRQADTPYDRLPEGERNSDRELADELIKLLTKGR
jgi:hypothetical protein